MIQVSEVQTDGQSISILTVIVVGGIFTVYYIKIMKLVSELTQITRFAPVHHKQAH